VVAGEDLAQSDPDQTRVIEALGALDLLVVQDPFLCETARLADVVLPAATVLEQDGTFTNGERRIQRVRAAVAPPADARQDWRTIVEIAARLGHRWSYGAPADVMTEIARAAPALFGGVSYERLDGDGLQWPCRAADEPGTSRLHVDGFLRGRGRITTVDHLASPEHDVDGYPYLLVTGRVLHHYNVGTMTRRTPQSELVADDALEVHPQDATRAGIGDGELVRVESRWGQTLVVARHSERVAPGNLFLSFHFPETHANRLVGPHHDPMSHCPAYKVTAVRIARST
jgi:predicted molibdopterin-dependent oxidoreductase YjgC